MNSIPEESSNRPCWFVGASYNRSEDQTERFLQEGIWENDFDVDHPAVEMTKSMKTGDRIAIKATYVRRKALPFENNGRPVSVMAIKAIGIVVENAGDGHTVRVDWTRVDPIREWYLNTYIRTVWKVTPGSDWYADALIGFAFENKKQDIDRFLKIDYWGKRYIDDSPGKQRYAWTSFYESFADQLLTFKDKRADLIDRIHAVATKENSMYLVQDLFSDGTSGPLNDICPFTTMAMFNRGITDSNRYLVASELANQLGVSESVPDKFEGIPVVDNRSSWFFNYEKDRKSDAIDVLWNVFFCAMSFSDSVSENPDTRSAFISAYESAIKLPNVGWKLSFGLYWIRPWSFPSLDTLARDFIEKELDTVIGLNGPKNRCNADDYLNVRDALDAKFKEEGCPVNSFPQLAYEVWMNKVGPTTYTLNNIVKEGCFIERSKLESILDSLRTEKNLILQGPPGTGKTWLARKLAFALIGQRDESKVRMVQFHPNLSYEDFVRGWRPAGDGRLTLVDGPFIGIRDAAEKDPNSPYVLVIEEINRGNPAQIFGEMLTLLEADKRTPDEALELVYPRTSNERFFIPNNLFVIGTMNIADRSLALVDLALRRRFAFIDLEPTLGEPWRDWVHSKNGIPKETLVEIENRIVDLNQTISKDTSLGPQFRLGHSYVTPKFANPIDDGKMWYRKVVGTKIGPLLDEYWFEDLESSKKAIQKLLEGF